MSEERRVVTVLFSDVTGSTAMGESNDPEDVRALLGRYYAIARAVISTHGGTLEKFIGDAVMAVFGIPQAHGDDAERALDAALALRDAVAKDPQTAGLALRIGVNTGEVVAARRSETDDFLITGDAVNVAARMQQHADPGAIMVGERTRRAVFGFGFGDEQQLTVKGKREPIGASVLIERVHNRRSAPTPFLGREHDLAQLDLVARRAFSERRPQLVTITAPAGTGKSRLVEEFARRIVGGARFAVAQCLPYGSAVTFLPLRGLVRDLLGATREEDVLPRVRDAFIRGGNSDEDAGRLSTLIGITLGDAPETTRHDRDEVFSAWRLLVEMLAATGPLVVVFEDLHWASDTLLDLVEHVTVSRISTPLVMCALARPELLDRKPNWGGGRRNFTSLGLEPLSDAQTRGLVEALTSQVPAEIAQRIVERSGGNPFFAGELVRAYDERRRAGVLDGDILLPDTVHATVLARIDALSAMERSTLELAAVAGRTARVPAIHALIADHSEQEIGATLESLVERDLLVPHGVGSYTFRHIVIREVAYATLPRAQRVRAHLRLARWLEEGAASRASERAELVAYHYRQAIAMSPGGRLPEGLDVRTVVDALERAARAAASGAARREATEQLREALRLAPPEDHLHLLELLGDLLLFGNDAMEGYSEGFERWRQSPQPDPRVGARLLVKRLGVAARWAGSLGKPMDRKEFEQFAGQARELLDRAPDAILEARLACARAFELTRSTDIDPSLLVELKAGTETAVALYAASGDVEGESEALDALAAVLRSGYGNSEKAFECTQRRFANLPRLSMLERVDTWSVALWELVYLGRYDEAVDTYRDARASLRAGEPEYVLSHGTSWAAYAAMLCGRFDDALALGDTLIAMYEESHGVVSRFTFQGWVGVLRVAAARLDSTRLARYRSAFAAIAQVELVPEPTRSMWTAFISRDAEAARRYVEVPSGNPDRKGECLALVFFDLGQPVSEKTLDVVERNFKSQPPALALRIKLGRALCGGAAELREAITALDAGHLVADAARAAALLALRTKDPADRADAQRRLRALGDHAYLQRLAEES